jgi:hypothetical protein
LPVKLFIRDKREKQAWAERTIQGPNRTLGAAQGQSEGKGCVFGRMRKKNIKSFSKRNKALEIRVIKMYINALIRNYRGVEQSGSSLGS